MYKPTTIDNELLHLENEVKMVINNVNEWWQTSLQYNEIYKDISLLMSYSETKHLSSNPAGVEFSGIDGGVFYHA